MARFLHVADSERVPPFKGPAVGFGAWVDLMARETEESRKTLASLPPGHVGRYLSEGAAADYGLVAHGLRSSLNGGPDAYTRYGFETGLVSRVMHTFGAAQFVRKCGYGEHGRTPGGRPVLDIDAEYGRACRILSRYVDVPIGAVEACGGDQGKLMALGN